MKQRAKHLAAEKAKVDAMTEDEKKAFLKQEAAKPKVYAGACAAGAPRCRASRCAALPPSPPSRSPPPLSAFCLQTSFP